MKDYKNIDNFDRDQNIKIRINDFYVITLSAVNAISISGVIKSKLLLNHSEHEINFNITIKDIQTYVYLDSYFMNDMQRQLITLNMLDDLLNVGISMQIPYFIELYIDYNPPTLDFNSKYLEIFKYINYSTEFAKLCADNAFYLGVEKIIDACLTIGYDFAELFIFNLNDPISRNKFITEIISADTNFMHLLTFYDKQYFSISDFDKLSKAVAKSDNYNDLFNDFAKFSYNYIISQSKQKVKCTKTLKNEQQKQLTIYNKKIIRYENAAKEFAEIKTKHLKQLIAAFIAVFLVIWSFFNNIPISIKKSDSEYLPVLFNYWRNNNEDVQMCKLVTGDFNTYLVSFLENGGNINLKDFEGRNLVYNAYDNRQFDTVHTLVEYGADISMCLKLSIERKDYNYIQYFVNNSDSIITPSRNIISNLIELYDRKISKTYIKPMLYYAIKSHDPNIVEYFIRLGDSVNSYYFKNNRHIPIFSYALEQRNTNIIKLFIENNMLDVNLTAEGNKNFLHVACIYDDYYVVKKLIEKKCNIHAKLQKSNYTALAISYINHNLPIFELLLQNGANTEDKFNSKTLLIRAIEDQRYDYAESLLKNGADVNSFDADGETSLHKACKLENESYANLLLKYNASINQSTKNGVTPLLVAASSSFELSKLLIDNGANMLDRDNNGTTVLDNAVNNDNFLLVEYILKTMPDYLDDYENIFQLSKFLIDHGVEDRTKNIIFKIY